ncbi:MAG: cryptochrome/photolyase family protein [Woeseiaceae bacterium]|nr:cryptochrome/photolyase family protein [Woeseiaceae bacterium]
MANPDSVLVILGNQLFPRKHLPDSDTVRVFMCEDVGLCTYVRHHQQKIVLFLSAMRSYADGLRDAGYDVHYAELDPDGDDSYEDRLRDFVESSGAQEIKHFEVEDKDMECRLIDFADEHDLQRTELKSRMFLCSRDEFAEFAGDASSLSMASFYKQQRRALGILVDDDGNPDGGQWSFDEDNRKPLPKDVTPPEIESPQPTRHTKAVVKLVDKYFADHPGDASQFWWPTTRRAALAHLRDFLDARFAKFGPYEDAMSTRSATVFHSALSPLMNLGLITPRDIVDRAVEHADDNDIPLQSIEGFVRQVIGWREFVRGVYRTFGDRQDECNFWSHERELTDAWYDGSTGIVPLDDTIRTAQRLGWTHHIPRLMVAGNLMTLCEIRPKSAWRWFMEMYVDSSEWVMGPNVYGMALFSDGGLFATKPYICGSNYMLKMSDYDKGDWCDIVDGLYWRFIDKHRDFFSGNPRLSLMPSALDRLDDDRRKRIFAAAKDFIDEYTRPAS